MSKKEKKLTKAEERRKAAFEELSEKMAEQGYKKVELKLGAVEANVMAVVISAPFVIAVLIPYVLCHGNPLNQGYNGFLFLLEMLVGIVLHELIHGLTWVLTIKGGWKSISFGFSAEYLAPYCTCNEPMKKGTMILAAIMPTIVLGFLPAVLGIIFGSALLILLGVVLIMGGGGDMLIILNILKYRTQATEVLFLDHPYEIGTILFEK